ncbi:peptidoglycan DD-metalloendopeptidase family protein [Novipirellula sp. SH528]|uniref:golvesin C-terminal-like domain-containing protein n=1 Tax=Novipirellula sp. SH528 TaxID=3454466 RepID=UPI003FA14EBE
MTDLNSAQQYVVHYEMDGITVASGIITGEAGVNLPYNWYRGVAFSAPGVRQVRVVIDGTNVISEANESNNVFVFNFTPTPADFPEKMIFPIGGEPGRDWSTVNYTDVNINAGQQQDFRGGAFQYDGHDAFDIALPNFDRMDDGIPIFAAASGTVIEASDGNFDREIMANNRPANYVAIDHGSGWVAYYYHLQRDTVAVEVGQSVSKGQMLGLTGSSGFSTDAHLHFSLYRNGSLVEPMFKPEDYFADPPIYQGDQTPSIAASGITDRAPWNDFKEQPNDIRQFRSDGTKDTWFWYRLSHLNDGESLAIEWYRPSGVLDATYNWTANGVARYGGHAWIRNTRVYEGTWTVVLKHDGAELTRETFEVIGSGGGPELDIRYGSTYIIDGRSTPINFGATTAGNPVITRSFTVSNWGTGNLTISGVDAPAGFQVISSPTTIAPGNSGLLTVQMTTNSVGKKWGDLIIHSNDTDENHFRFGIEGTISGALPPGAASLQQDLPALAIATRLPQALFPDMTIGNVTGLGLANGLLTASIVSGRSATDKLLIQSQDVAMFGTEVLFQGNLVANVVSDGSSGALKLDLLTNVSVNVVTEIAKSIHFIDETAAPASRRRVVDLQVSDSANVASNVLRRSVTYSDVLPEIDFGDAPLPYPTLITEDGARHIPIGPRLGALRDIELNGRASPSADGDDNAGIDDEDGVLFGFIAGGIEQASVNIDLQNAGNAFVDAWIDFNRDGDWDDPGEKILNAVNVSTGLQALSFVVPSGATTGDTFARVRISTAGGLAPTGEATDGEVEDYRVTIHPTASANVLIDAGNNLSIQSISGLNFNDSITLHAEGANLRVSDPHFSLIAGAGVTQDASDAVVPMASITGSQGITVNTDGGTDVVNIEGLTTSLPNNVAISVTNANVILGGDLQLNSNIGFTPTIGDSFVLITSTDGLAGSFNSANLPTAPPGSVWDLVVGSNEVRLNLLPIQLVLDTEHTATTTLVGGWSPSVSVPGFEGANYVYTAPGTNSTATFKPIIGTAGQYEVFVKYSSHANRASNAKVSVTHADGTFAVLQNQKTGGGVFHSLGRFNFAAGTGGKVRIDAAGSDGYVTADAVQFSYIGDVVAAPSADLASPTSGQSLTAAVLNANGFIDVTFHSTAGLDTATVVDAASEFTLSGSGVGTAVVDGAGVLQSGTTYRYSFTGSFVPGDVSVNFTAGAFANTTASGNLAEQESFTLTDGMVRITLDNTDATQVNNWAVSASTVGYVGPNYLYTNAGGAGRLVYTPTIPSDGSYEVFVNYTDGSSRASNAAYEVVSQNGTSVVRVDQSNGGGVYQSLGTFNFLAGTSGSVTLRGSDADGFVVGDAMQFVRVGSTTGAPTATLADPVAGASIVVTTINGRDYVDVTFSDTSGAGLDVSTITDSQQEFTLSGPGAASVSVNGSATLVSGTTYRYATTGDFAPGAVDAVFAAGTFADSLGNANIDSIASFVVTEDLQEEVIVDNSGPGFTVNDPNSQFFNSSSVGGFVGSSYLAAPTGSTATATWTPTLANSGQQYQVYVRYTAHELRASNATYEVTHDGGTTPVVIDQTSGGGTWVLLGTFALSDGAASVKLLTEGANQYVVADAVRFVLM